MRKAKKFVNQNNNIDSLYSDLKCDSVKLANRVQGKSSYYTDIHKKKMKMDLSEFNEKIKAYKEILKSLLQHEETRKEARRRLR